MVTLRKTFKRDIRQSLSRFLSILAITALGAGFFAGLRAIGPDMKRTADNYYAESNLMDYRVLSSMGFTKEDVGALRELEDVQAVMPAQRVDALIESRHGEAAVRIHTLPEDTGEGNSEYLNQPKLLQGRLPENSGECVVGSRTISAGESYEVGDVLTISSGNTTSTRELFAQKELTIVGIVRSPIYVSKVLGSTTIGSGSLSNYVYVTFDSFDLDVYTELYVKAAGTEGLSAFSDEYESRIADGIGDIEALGDERVALRYEEIYAEGKKLVDEGQSEYDEKKAEAEARFAQAWSEIEEAEARIADGEREISEAQAETRSSSETLEQVMAEIDEGQITLDGAKPQIDRSQEEYDEQYVAYSEKLEEYDANRAEFESTYSQLEQLLAEASGFEVDALRAAIASLEEQRPALDAAEQELSYAKAQLDDAKELLDAALAEYDDKAAQLEDAREQYDDGMTQLNEAIARINSYKQELSQARSELAAAKDEYFSSEQEVEEEFARAQADLADARQKLRELEEPKWYVYDRESSSGYAGFSSDADRIGAIAAFIPIFFFLVAALVSLTTMTRMVEEQRLQIGALKALGFGKFSIAAKYILYAALASTVGAVFGIVIGLIVFPTAVWNAYEILYQMPDILLGGNTDVILLALLASVLSTTVSAFAASVGSMSEVPAKLMRPKAPKAGKRVILERIPFVWKRLKFSNKVTVRNLLLNKKRFFMTIIGVLGCTALLLTGLGLSDAINGIAPKQFGEIELHDAAISLYDHSDSGDDTTLNDYLDGIAEILYYENVAVNVGSEQVTKTTLDVALYIADDMDKINDFIRFAGREDGKSIEFPNGDGVILTEKLADTLKVGVGDTIEVSTPETDGSDVHARLTVAGIMENYVYHLIYITPETYEKLFDTQPSYSMAVVKFTEAEKGNISEHVTRIIQDENVMGAMQVSSIRDNVDDMLGSLNAIVWLIIISAALLAIVVLFNLTNINITERVREIATLKVLGFYSGEVNKYIFRESRALALIGIALGLVGGVYLANFVITTAEVNEVMFQRDISLLSYIYAVIFTLLSSELVNLIMRRRLRSVDMVESLKSAE